MMKNNKKVQICVFSGIYSSKKVLKYFTKLLNLTAFHFEYEYEYQFNS